MMRSNTANREIANTETETNVTTLQQALHESEKKYANLITQIERMATQLTASTSREQQLQRQINTTQALDRQLNAELAKLRMTHETRITSQNLLREENAKLKEQLQQAAKNNSQLYSQLSHLLPTSRSAASEIERMTTQLAASNTREQQLQHQVSTMQASSEHLNAELTRLRMINEVMTTRQNLLLEANARVGKQLQQTTEENDKLRQAIGNLQHLNTQLIHPPLPTTSALMQQISMLRTNLFGQSETIVQYRTEVNLLKNEKEALKNKLLAIIDSPIELETTPENETVAETNTNVAELYAIIDQQRAEIEQLKNEKEAVKDKVTAIIDRPINLTTKAENKPNTPRETPLDQQANPRLFNKSKEYKNKNRTEQETSEKNLKA